MANDVRRLFEWADAPDFDYRELQLEERSSEAGRAWSAIASVNRALRERAPSARPVRAERPPLKPFTVAVVSMSGGVGRTTVVANLASAFSQSGRRVAAADLDPANVLGLHHGLESTDALGVSAEELSAEGVQALHAPSRAGGPTILPFGNLDPGKLASLEWALTLEREWLEKRLARLLPADSEVLLLDTPAGARPMVEQALALCEAAIVVLTPDASSYATLPALEALLEENARSNCAIRVLVNRFDATRALDRDVLAALRTTCGRRLFEQPVQEDSAVPESLARRRPLLHDAADSQAAADLSAVAEWVDARAAARVQPGRASPRLVAKGG